ncbi:MAG: kelch repeat-containing protein, partial [Bdellovibrionia bacterium]
MKIVPFSLDFSKLEGLPNPAGNTIGFTMVDAPSNPLTPPILPSVPGYDAYNVNVVNGKLQITTTSGINYLDPSQSPGTNSQMNALGAGFVAPSKFSIQVVLIKPDAGTGNSEQAGLWFGLGEDDYVKLVALSTGNGTNIFEMRKEVGAVSGVSDVKRTDPMSISGNVVTLKLEVDRDLGMIEGLYRLDGSVEVSLGILPIPASFCDGKTLPDGNTKNITFAGIFATNRNSATPLVYTFDDFSVSASNVGLYFNQINWALGGDLPYNVNEAQGRVLNGNLYSFGGFDSQKGCCTPTKRAFVYDPKTQSWSPIADLPFTPNGANFGGVTHAGITTDGVDMFLAGGYTSNVTGNGQIFGTKQVWKYIVGQNTYVPLPDLPVNISAGQLEYLDNKLHYIGGTNSS